MIYGTWNRVEKHEKKNKLAEIDNAFCLIGYKIGTVHYRYH